ncbi:MAG: glycosyltransferase family 2 protein [Lachnospiraceae bacterium]|nr:glycosyltransferase family 2 protein [Lachnospiraceae bacterium]
MISVIVPIYNTSEYLEQCIGSILNQTYRNLEVILVDDGSSYLCGKACDEYAVTDCRVKVIHKENGGLVSARKTGLEAATGEFVGYVDSDDWIEPDYYEKMVLAQEKTGAEMVLAGHLHDIGEDSRKVKDNFPTGVYTRELLLPTLLYSGRFFEYGIQPHMVTKLFKREILRKTQMCVDDRIVIGEDAAVVYPSVLEAEKIVVLDVCAYHYVQHPNSMTKKEREDKEDIYGLLFEHLEKAFKNKNVWEILESQLQQYKKYLLFMNQIALFDEDILVPYGGIRPGSRVIIYGAGVLGQKMYRYLVQKREIDIVLWVDKKYKSYQETGFEVFAPDEIGVAVDYDFILIANTVQSIAESIRKYLVHMGIDNRKILWFSEEFRKA